MKDIIKISSIHGECPVCGTSWQGRSFLHIYKKFAEEQALSLTDDELKEIIKERHDTTHQSRLMYNEKSDIYICPECNQKFKLKTYE